MSKATIAFFGDSDQPRHVLHLGAEGVDTDAIADAVYGVVLDMLTSAGASTIAPEASAAQL